MWVLALDLGEILREFWEILGKHRILDESSVESKGLSPKHYIVLFLNSNNMVSLYL